MLRSVHVKRVPWLMSVWHLRSTCLVERLKAGCESEENLQAGKTKGLAVHRHEQKHGMQASPLKTGVTGGPGPGSGSCSNRLESRGESAWFPETTGRGVELWCEAVKATMRVRALSSR